MVALFNASGGIASLLVGWLSYYRQPSPALLTMIATYLSILIGGITFTGSLVAWVKLSELMKPKPGLGVPLRISNLVLFVIIIITGVHFLYFGAYASLVATIALSLVFGVIAVIPIGGKDMPIVISLLNSYAGLAACAVGFEIANNLLIVTGALIGSSGIILTRLMCKAMNRPLSRVLFGGYWPKAKAGEKGYEAMGGEIRPITVDDAFYLIESASLVVIVPGYGMAVAQAQHALKELGTLMEAGGCDVRYAIHPVAGRMPGHMNVLLAEADVPYEKLYEMDDVNPVMDTVDLCMIIGANDVVNPAALEQPGSPIYGMPIIQAYRAKTVLVLKRSMAAGFSGVENPLFYKENTRMLFGNAKNTLQALSAAFKKGRE
ncbi:MAG: NAD(P)(+) transhydrogenase (Re/Si-specific) subunit beta, partial [Nitrospirae bacterium]|nr:NAD(P)(+) transhydrogenase (Re/Si-specific) subunit beta [Nitrospirota bacterium]